MSKIQSRGEAARESTGLKRTLKSFLEKLRQTVSHIARETLADSDTDYEYSTVEQMFIETGRMTQVDISRDRHDLDEGKQTLENRSSMNSETVTANSETYEDIESRVTFETFDPVVECAKIRRNTKGPFNEGPAIWEQRRKLWLQRTKEDHKNDEMDMKIVPRDYFAIYKKLVCENVPLKRNLNLEDVIKVINVGWAESSTWERAAKGLG